MLICSHCQDQVYVNKFEVIHDYNEANNFATFTFHDNNEWWYKVCIEAVAKDTTENVKISGHSIDDLEKYPASKGIEIVV